MSQALSNLAIGSKVKFGSYSVNGETAQPIVWTIVAKNHTGYPDNSVTLHTSNIIDLRCFDAKNRTIAIVVVWRMAITTILYLTSTNGLIRMRMAARGMWRRMVRTVPRTPPRILA